ncbi:hypothetical protein [uncultured Massilia sp.]|uniref:hypothetical protein n=1 Tax=uncultured Massilia sp. TaxID=169973 RepID=UPI0035A2BB7C
MQDEQIEIASLSGASAGAINAAVMADGYAHGGARSIASGAPSAARPCSARCSGPRSTTSPAALPWVTGANDVLTDLSISSKFKAEPGFLQMLHDYGFEAAGAWLDKHRDDIGVRGTLDPAAVFGPEGE